MPPTWRFLIRRSTAFIYLLVYLLVVALTCVSIARPAPMPKHWHAPSWWLPQALCVHSRESGDWHIHNEPYANGFQFMLGTWISAGGSASTWVTASPREQLYRAWVVYLRDGRSWREWPTTRRACGLR